MKYIVPNQYFQGIFDTYILSEFNINKVNKIIFAKLNSIKINQAGTIDADTTTHNIQDIVEIMIDSNWDINSTPVAKPDGFDSLDPMTWGELSWDDIPKIQNKDKLYATNIFNGEGNIEENIINYLITNGAIPSTGTFI
mgnify:CR=1 FL=1